MSKKFSDIYYWCKCYLEPLIRTDKIISCGYNCETAEKEKCSICSKENICSNYNERNKKNSEK